MDSAAKPDQLAEKSSTRTEHLSAAIDQLWIRFLPEIRKRVELLQTAAAVGGGTGSLREEAVATAHKLAGALGTFNLERGTELAREYELIAERDDVPNDATSERLVAIANELGVIVDGRK
jgi:HPt (histidine-containing phosphotransfer) domain-containing protein